MQITNNYKPYTIKYNYPLNSILQPKTNTLPEVPACKKNLSNIHYRPIFTGHEISDSEYIKKFKFLENKFQDYNQHHSLSEIFSEFNKDNIDLATKLLTDRTINQQKLKNYMAKILENTTEENSDFAETLCRDTHFPPKLIAEVIAYIDKNSLPFAQLLYEEDSLALNIPALKSYNKDLYQGICQYLLENYLPESNDEELVAEYFENLAKINASKENLDNLKFLKQVYNEAITNAQINPNNLGILKSVKSNNISLLKELYQNPLFKQDKKITSQLDTFSNKKDFFEDHNISDLTQKVEYQRKLSLKHPERYINGKLSPENAKIVVNDFYNENYVNIMLLSSIFDKETIDTIFRKRFNDVSEILNYTSKLTLDEVKILKSMVNTQSNQNKPLLPNQKFDCLKLIKEYHRYQIPLDQIKQMIKENSLDFAKIYSDIFKQTLQNTGVFKQGELNRVPLKNLISWDIRYTHLLSEELNKKNKDSNLPLNGLKDTIYAATKGDFKTYIANPRNIYGSTNERTQRLFNIYKLNYDNWLNPPKSCNVTWNKQNISKIRLAKYTDEIIENIEIFQKIDPNLQKYINKVLGKNIKENKFTIDEKFTQNPAALEKFLRHIITQLNKVWDRASQNLKKVDTEDLQTMYRASGTLLIKSKLEAILNEIKTLDQNEEFDLTIKMWDRDPRKDLFQGNYSTCCIGMGKENGIVMPHYLLNSSLNMIEIQDNKTGDTIGNALCYWANDKRGVPSLIIDNIEINNHFQIYKNNPELLSSITQYAKNIVKEISSNPRSKIYLGSKHNDLQPLNKTTEKNYLNFIGDLDCNTIYLDAYGGWILKERSIYNKPTELYELE